ncbi:Hydrolase, alpha/beta fold family functionally coupled to Phosphoribulokinase [Myxococcus hansupus]|uniref:Hydrolase, alpha/beta fold family functionally coupled to Phosphoribulokinase n=1 Tax=Pseudomyxococcus hansupus TaxID=1297742 RepID=A0A0H4X861_9BACT|nr:alpha/beta hydrolase [Myxococcus hansupus]AKQ64017.1 Hydrolase, alpha/beta fold family functionally coupled to Phosphoribulokinase [Myxococcus hansupus]
MPTALESLTVDAEGLALHVRQRAAASAPAVLFLHGWLDHSHSFDAVVAHLPETWRLVLLDFRGMGRSAHVGPGATYHFSDYALDVEATLDGLGLDAVHVVGHSLGGIVAQAYAAARPERVKSVTLIESLGPAGGPPEGALGRLRSALNDARRPPNRKRYPSVEAAAARLLENSPTLTQGAALYLARHGTEPVDGGLAFTFDPRHRRRFGMGYDEAQWMALQAHITCPVHLILATHGLRHDDALMRSREQGLRTLAHPPLHIPGGHHVHMEKPAVVAEALIRAIH